MTIYIINEDHKDNPPKKVKIGYSTYPPNRSKEFRTLWGRNRIILTREGDECTEHKYHKKFTAFRVYPEIRDNEVFYFIPEMLTWTPDDEPAKETFGQTFAPAINTICHRIDPGDLSIFHKNKRPEKASSNTDGRINPGDLSPARLIQKTSRHK